MPIFNHDPGGWKIESQTRIRQSGGPWGESQHEEQMAADLWGGYCPNKDRSWECYSLAHGQGLEQSAPFIDESHGERSGGEFTANARKWESSVPPAQ
jgi:hypothetical protein